MSDYVKVNALWALLSVPLGLWSLYLFLFKRKPTLDLKDKVVFISGASSGLGKACATVFFEAGCRIVLSGRNEDALVAVKETLARKEPEREAEIDLVVMDLEKLEAIPERVAEAIACFGHVDIVINNAGMSYRGQGVDTCLDVYQKLLAVNFLGHVQVTKAFLPQMMQRKSGHIAVISSIQGLLAIPNRSPYSASKHALEGYFASMRAELSLYDIDVCVINPYYIKTNLSANAVCSDGSKYGKMDENTEKGMSPCSVAQEVLECVVNREENRILCPFHIQLAICARTMAPSLYFKMMAMRAMKERRVSVCKKTS